MWTTNSHRSQHFVLSNGRNTICLGCCDPIISSDYDIILNHTFLPEVIDFISKNPTPYYKNIEFISLFLSEMIRDYYYYAHKHPERIKL